MLLESCLFFLSLLGYIPGRASFSATTRTATPSPSTSITTTSTSFRPYRLLTWNVLGPAYATRRDNAKYPFYLDWSYRSRLISQILLKADADIVCLQEVPVSDNSHLEQLLQPLRQVYETIVVQNVTTGHPVGCATLLRKGLFRLIEVESRSRAVWVHVGALVAAANNGKLQKEETQGSVGAKELPLTIANLHLIAGRDNEYTRFRQLRSLLQRCRRCDGTAPLILAGDCNMFPNYNPAHTWLSTGFWNTTVAQDFVPSDKQKEWVARHADRLTPDLRWIDCTTTGSGGGGSTRTNGTTTAPHHGLSRTFARGGILDSIWVSRCNSSHNNSHHQEFRLAANETSSGRAVIAQADPWYVLPPPTDESMWPSPDHPSDHWILGMEFTLKSGC